MKTSTPLKKNSLPKTKIETRKSFSIYFSFTITASVFCAQAALSGQTGMSSDTEGRYYDQQWALKNSGQKICDMTDTECQSGSAGADISAETAWTIQKDCKSVTVAVLDTGVDAGHPDLVNNVVTGKNFVPEVPTDDAADDNIHGTHVTGTIAGEGHGAAGICHAAKIIPIKVASGEGRLLDSDIIKGIDFASQSGARVMNASFGGEGKSKLIQAAIGRAKNTVFVAAAGNGDRITGIGFDIDKRPVYPAAYPLSNIVVVAATDNRDQLASFSNFGLKRVALAAPGVSIISTVPRVLSENVKELEPFVQKTPGYMKLDGTSMATPHVTGATALLLSKFPNLTPVEAIKALRNTADPIKSLNGKVATAGRLNLQKLVLLQQ